jgi:xylan 1,4-beta-xylosidase
LAARISKCYAFDYPGGQNVVTSRNAGSSLLIMAAMVKEMNRTNFEQVQFNYPGDVKPIITNLIHTWPHWHDEIEIVFSCQGELLLETENGERILKEGDFSVVNSAETHAVNTVNEEKHAGHLLFMLQLNKRFLRNLYADIDAMRFSGSITKNARADEICRLLLFIMDEEQSGNENKTAVIHGLCGAVVALLIRYFSIPNCPQAGETLPDKTGNPRKNNFDRGSERLKRIIAYVNEHYAENPSLDDISKVVFVSPFHLSHVFTGAMGMSYSQYLNYVKVDMARRDVALTKDTIIEIMERHGFASVKTFNRVFKALVGYSPSAYRKLAASGATGDIPGILQLEGKMPGNYVNFQNPVIIPRALYYEYNRNKNLNNQDNAGCITKAIDIDSRKRTGVLDRYFFKMTGQARASDILREKVQEHFRLAQEIFGFEYVRFHGIFNDEMCIITDSGRLNWTYIDDVLDFLMKIHMRPFIELSFMPSSLASGSETMFFYKGNVTPPRDWDKWGNLVRAFIEHIAARYGMAEITQWYFEVWNEPNIESYWTGSFEDYMRLYRITAEQIKAVSPALKIGGPAVSSFNDHDACGFTERFLAFCEKEKLPVNFVSAHPYPVVYYMENGILRETLLGPDSTKGDMIWLKNVVRGSAFPLAEIHLDEWNSSARDRDLVHDTAFMAVFILHNYLSCTDLADSLCYWALTDRFEEHGLGSHEFYGGFGLLTVSKLKKPQFYALEALKRLGDIILGQGEDYIVTCSCDASGQEIAEIQVLCWNYVHYNDDYATGKNRETDFYDRYRVFKEKEPRRFIFNINFSRDSGDYVVEKTVFSCNSGSVFDFWLQNGAFEHLTEEMQSLIRVQCVPKQNIEIHHAKDSALVLKEIVPPFGFVLFNVRCGAEKKARN